MNRNEAITALVKYALEKELIEQEEKVWAVNRILEVMPVSYTHLTLPTN